MLCEESYEDTKDHRLKYHELEVWEYIEVWNSVQHRQMGKISCLTFILDIG